MRGWLAPPAGSSDGRRNGLAGRRNGRFPSAEPSADRVRVSGSEPISASLGPRQPDVRRTAKGRGKRRFRRIGIRRGRGIAGYCRTGRTLCLRPVGRGASARCDRAGFACPSAPAADGRAACESRRRCEGRDLALLGSVAREFGCADPIRQSRRARGRAARRHDDRAVER